MGGKDKSVSEQMSIEEYRAMQKKPHKYRSEPMTVDGHRFPSRREARRYRELKLMEHAGIISELKLQVRYALHVNGIVVTHFVADFVYIEKGQQAVEDAKGFRTDIFRIKKKMMAAEYGIDIKET